MLLNGVSTGVIASQGVTPPVPVPENTSAPTISGTEQVGHSLFTSVGIWTNDPDLYEYRWQVDDDGPVDIDGETTQNLGLSEDQEGLAVRSGVLASNDGGPAEEWAYSEWTDPIAPASEDAPVNIEPPEITGLLTQGSELTFDVGIWSGEVETMEIRVRQTDPAETLLDWTEVEGDTTGTVESAVGGVLYLDVRATGPGGATIETSEPFGPIEAAGDQWIIGLVIHTSEAHNPTPSGSPVTWTLVAPNPAENQYDIEKGWGFVGSLSDATSGFSTFSGRSDVRLSGRWSGNLSPAQLGIRIDVPGPGTYIIHAAFGSNNAITPRLEIRDGPDHTGAILHRINDGDALTTGSGSNVMDAADNVETEAEWVGASPYGGEPLEIEVTGSSIWIGRPNDTGATVMNCFALLKKAN